MQAMRSVPMAGRHIAVPTMLKIWSSFVSVMSRAVGLTPCSKRHCFAEMTCATDDTSSRLQRLPRFGTMPSARIVFGFEMHLPKSTITSLLSKFLVNDK